MDQIGSLSITTSPDGSPVPVAGPLTLAELISQYPIPVTDDGTHTRLDSANALLDLIATYNSSIVSNTFDIKVSTDSINSKLDILTHIDSDLHTSNTHLNQISVNTQSIYNQAVIAQGTYDAIAFHTQEINGNTDQIILNQTNGTQRTIITDGINNVNVGLGNVDAMPNSNYGVFTNSRSFIYGGSGAWDRVRSVQIGNNTIGTGLLAAGAWAQLPNGNYSAILLDANRKMDIRPLAAAVDTVTVSGFVQPAGGFAEETTLQSVLTQVTAVNANTDQIEAKLDTLHADEVAALAKLTSIDTKLSTPMPVLVQNALVKVPYDQVQITAVNANNDPTTVLYKLATVTVKTMTITYDGLGDISNVVVV